MATSLPPPPPKGGLPPKPGGLAPAPGSAAVGLADGPSPATLLAPPPVQLPAELADQINQIADAPDTSAANSATLVVGDTGSGKSELLRTAAEYCWETFQMITRIYAGDPGGFGTQLQSLMRLGIVQAWRLRNHNEPFETAELASQGWWPEELDPLTGFAAPNVRLIPPTITEYTISCPNGHQVQRTTNPRAISMQQVCAACQTVVNATNWIRGSRTLRSPGFKRVGLYCYESLTSWTSWVMNDMADRAGRDELGGEKGAISKIVSGDLILGSNNRAHYGFAQNRAEQWVINSTKILGAVMPPIWTALELRASDEGGLPIYGPKIAGKAKTDEVPSWFGNCLHAEKARDTQGNEVHRLWLSTHRHQSEGNIPHLAKHRSDPQLMPLYLEDPVIPGTSPAVRQPFTGFSLGIFFRLLNTALAQSVKKNAVKYGNAPVFTGGLHLDAEEEEAAALLARPGGAAPSPGVVNRANPPAMVPGVPSGVVSMAPQPPAGQPTVAPQQRPPALPPQTPVQPVAAPPAQKLAPPPPAMAPKPAPMPPAAAPMPQAAPLPLTPAAAPMPAAPPQAAPQATAGLPPAQPVSVSGPTAAPVRPPASVPPPPPPGARALGRKPAPATVIPPAPGGSS